MIVVALVVSASLIRVPKADEELSNEVVAVEKTAIVVVAADVCITSTVVLDGANDVASVVKVDPVKTTELIDVKSILVD
jgi:hypothetical protein